MRTLVIGDIHGCFRALRGLEKGMAFKEEDHVILLGDLVDRGPHTKHVIDWAIQRKKRGGKLTILRGNHEWIMLWAKDDPTATKNWLTDFVGGTDTLNSYAVGTRTARLTDIPQQHWDLIEHGTHSWIEDENYIYVHAHVDPGLPMSEQPADQLFWSRFQTQPLHMSGKRIVYLLPWRRLADLSGHGHHARNASEPKRRAAQGAGGLAHAAHPREASGITGVARRYLPEVNRLAWAGQ
jgi:serine/threonine protein phosphatase 1